MHDARRALGLRRLDTTKLVALLAALVLLVAACGGGRDDDDSGSGDGDGQTTGTGGDGDEQLIDTSSCNTDPSSVTVDGDTIRIGTSLPQSGLYAAFSNILLGEQAYIEYVNKDLGGVEVAGTKYQIELVDKDDEYLPAETVNNVNQLLTDDNVFALFNVVGTRNNLAIREIVNEECVPGLFAATGSPAWGDPAFPWMLGTGLVPYSTEMKALVDYLQADDPEATIAILRASDDFGRAYSETLGNLIEGTDLRIVDEETYNPEQFDTSSQVTSLAASDADVFVLGATLLACPDALGNVRESGWQPSVIYMSGTCTSKTLMEGAGDSADGVISVLPGLDPADPANASNEAMTLYKEKVAQYSPDADATNGIVAYGWTTAAMLVETLSQSPALDRLSVMETARQIELSDVGLMIPGTTFSVSADDWFLGETFNLAQYSVADAFFTAITDEPIDVNGETASFTPENLIAG
jgi:branched-chain amino acid transport system substrate-binding protein